jgi:hypothetical protein
MGRKSSYLNGGLTDETTNLYHPTKGAQSNPYNAHVPMAMQSNHLELEAYL